MRLGEVDDFHDDEKKLCNECQHHRCGSYCMRNSRKKLREKDTTNESPPSLSTPASSKTKRSVSANRYCRAGAGHETNKNACDTPGFQLRSHNALVRDERDFLKLEMKRNSLRMIQTPITALRGWRGNCDIKILLYDCRDGEPSPEDIAEVTDYVVAYACKGNETLSIERETMRDIIMRYV